MRVGQEENMAILEVNCLEKIYKTRLGGNQVQALWDVSFSVEQENIWQLWENPEVVRQHF